MTPSKNDMDPGLNAVLVAFVKECPYPSPEEIAKWRKRYPEYAGQIMGTAADLMELSIQERGIRSANRPTEEQLMPARTKFHQLLRYCERLLDKGRADYQPLSEGTKSTKQ